MLMRCSKVNIKVPFRIWKVNLKQTLQSYIKSHMYTYVQVKSKTVQRDKGDHNKQGGVRNRG